MHSVGDTTTVTEKEAFGISSNSTNKLAVGLLAIGAVLSFFALITIYLFTPAFPTGSEGFNVSGHPVFYMISEAFTAFFLFTIAFIFSIIYLWKKNLIYDSIIVSAAKTGILASLLTLSIGILWSRVEWGFFWQWEPRQTMTLVMFIFYVAMLLFRTTVDDIKDKAKLTAVFGIAAFPTVPMTNFIVGALHPPAQRTSMSANTFTGVILLFFGTLAIYLVFLYFTYYIEESTKKVEQFKQFVLNKLDH
jgi:ABC-type transport system involved in cytochrome c biogenesis permease subunit